jgi:hypothetical protein
MLPEFPELSKRLDKLLVEAVQRETIGNDPILGGIPRHILFEGRPELERENGTRDNTGLQQFKTEWKLKRDDLKGSFQQVFSIVYISMLEAFENFAKQQFKYLIDQIERVTKEVGTYTDLSGKEFTIDDFFETLEKMDFSFDENGNPYLPQMVGGKYAAEKFNQVLTEAFANPDTIERFKKLIEGKREEWHDRESDRILVG